MKKIRIPFGGRPTPTIYRTLNVRSEFFAGQVLCVRRHNVWSVERTNVDVIRGVKFSNLKHELIRRGFSYEWATTAGETPALRGTDTALQIESHDGLRRSPGGAPSEADPTVACLSLQTAAQLRG